VLDSLTDREALLALDAEKLGAEHANWANLVDDVVTKILPYRRTSAEGRFRFYMGKIMATLRGKVPARKAAEELNKAMSRRDAEAESTG